MVTHVQEYVALWDLLRKLNTVTPGLQLGLKDVGRGFLSSSFLNIIRFFGNILFDYELVVIFSFNTK